MPHFRNRRWPCDAALRADACKDARLASLSPGSTGIDSSVRALKHNMRLVYIIVSVRHEEVFHMCQFG